MPPPGAEQIYVPPPVSPRPPRLDEKDEEILTLIREQGPTSIWPLLTRLADAEAPGRRAQGRELRLALWHRLRRLIHVGILFRHHRTAVAVTPPLPQPRQAARRRRQRASDRRGSQIGTVVSADVGAAGSTLNKAKARRILEQVEAEAARPKHIFKQVEDEPTRPTSDPGANTAETEFAAAPHEISAAARALGRLPRHHKRWTGWLHGQHCWRERLVVLPGGEVAPLIWCSRGRVLLRNVNDLPVAEWLIWGARRAQEVTLFRHPAAVALGRMKRGVREKKSEAKTRAARANGFKPARNGRRRGRPPRSAALPGSGQTSTRTKSPT